jgi:hypothetical protein
MGFMKSLVFTECRVMQDVRTDIRSCRLAQSKSHNWFAKLNNFLDSSRNLRQTDRGVLTPTSEDFCGDSSRQITGFNSSARFFKNLSPQLV